MKRLCIYLVYDRQNIVDNYIGYMLKELKTCVDHLAVVCNMTRIARGREVLETYADRIFCRENIGFDAGGFQDALCRLIGWDRVLEYDELVLANDSMFGPFRPMRDIFAQMDEKRADFWGLAKHGERRVTGGDDFSEYVQSYFLVVRSRMLHSTPFRDYWEGMPVFSRFVDVVRRHEEKFTPHFGALGFTYDVLADTRRNDSGTNLANNYFQYAVISYELMKKRNFPFLKKQQIAYDTLSLQTQENLRLAIDYIDRETDYDVDLVWDNIIRTMDVADLQRSLHLQYVVPAGLGRVDGGICAAVVVFAGHGEAAEDVLEYLQRLDPYCSVRVVAENPEVLAQYRGHGVECAKGAWGDRRLFRELCTYDFVCVLHDTDMTSDIRPSCTGKSYFYNIWENLLKDAGHVAGILETFGREPRLGFLAPPQPNFASYFGDYGKGWDGNFEGAAGAAENLGLACRISREKAPFRVTEDFWIRGRILKRLEGLEEGDLPYLPWLWSYLAQDAGCYSGIVETPGYAGMNEVNMQYYLAGMVDQARKTCGGLGSFSEYRAALAAARIREFCGRYPKIFIYGTGRLAGRYRDLLTNVAGCIVSDGQDKPEDFDGLPVMYLSEAPVPDGCGIVLCMNDVNQEQVAPLLEARGIRDYLRI